MGSRRHPRSWKRAAFVVFAALALAFGGGGAGLAFAGCGGSDGLSAGQGDGGGGGSGANEGGGGNGGERAADDAGGGGGLADGPHFDQSLIVTTSLGPVQGALDLGVPSFRGIPYAAPPVGNLRWNAPLPPTAWTAPIDATAFTSTCIQLDTDGDLLAGGSEDCLTLNIWTPTHGDLDAGAKLPVLAFLHGGYFVKGGASYQWHGELVYDGAALAAFAHAVVVTIQYRLGAFGFLAHPSLSTAAAPHGNYGLLDQIAALQLVRSDIGHFGGDSTNVTIFGQSSGGSSVAALLASPLARGLFSRAIIESGGFSAYSVATGTSDATIVANALGCGAAADVAGCLRGKDASDVAVSLPDSALGPARWHFLADGYALPDDPLSMFTAGQWNQMPVLLGTNRDELSAMVYDYLRAASLPTPTNQASYESDVSALYPANGERGPGRLSVRDLLGLAGQRSGAAHRRRPVHLPDAASGARAGGERPAGLPLPLRPFARPGRLQRWRRGQLGARGVPLPRGALRLPRDGAVGLRLLARRVHAEHADDRSVEQLRPYRDAERAGGRVARVPRCLRRRRRRERSRCGRRWHPAARGARRSVPRDRRAERHRGRSADHLLRLLGFSALTARAGDSRIATAGR